MTPDYDAGDLVLCLEAGPVSSPLRLGQVYRCESLIPPEHLTNKVWGAVLTAPPPPYPFIAFAAALFRRVDPKPLEFFTGVVTKIREPA